MMQAPLMKRLLFLTIFVLTLFPQITIGADTKQIAWEDLLPVLPPQEDPLARFSQEDKEMIEYVIYIRSYLQQSNNPLSQAVIDEMNKILPKLKRKGVDVDAIIADRTYRNSAVNSQLKDQVVKIAGYLLPLDLSGKTVTDFLLVPYVGACIHTPPPPPNQIIHAVTATPQPYNIDEIYKPVWITGELQLQTLSKELFLSDGSNNIDIGYSMSVEKIEEYSE